MKNAKGTTNPLDKSEYRVTLSVLIDALTVESRINQLNKVFCASEDELLKRQIWSVLEMLRYIVLNMPKSIQPKVLDLSDSRVGNLLHYCANGLTSAKPQWQIIAESSGWRPH